MMIELIWDDSFVKQLKKWKRKYPNLIETFESKLSTFRYEPFHSSLKTHGLSGHLKGYWALSITYKQRLLFEFLSDKEVLLIDIGKHDDVY